MWEPDIASLRLALGLVGGAGTVTLAILWHANQGLPGLGRWLLAGLLSMLAYLLPPAVLWPRPELGVAANCVLTLSALIVLMDGILRFRHVGSVDRGPMPLVMLILGVGMVMLVCAGRAWLHVVLHGLLAALLLAAVLPVLVRNTRGMERLVSIAIGMVALLLAALFVWQAGGALLVPGFQGPPAGWMLAATLCWSLVWNFGAAILINLRGQAIGQALDGDRNEAVDGYRSPAVTARVTRPATFPENPVNRD